MPSGLSNKQFDPLSRFFSPHLHLSYLKVFYFSFDVVVVIFFLLNFETTEMVETITFPQYFTVSESFLQGLYQTEPCVTLYTKWMNKPGVREAKELHMEGHSINNLRLPVYQTASFHMKMTRGLRR